MGDSRLAKGLLYLLAQAIPGIAAVFTLAVYTRWLSAEEYGIYSTLVVVVTAANLMLFNWLYVGVYRFWNDGQLGLQDLQAIMVLSLAGLSGLILIMLLPVALWTQQYLLIGAFALLLMCSAFFGTYQRVNAITQQADRFLYTEMFKVLIASVVGVGLVWLGYSWPGIIAGLCLGFSVALLLSRNFRRMFFVWPRLAKPVLLRRLLVYGLPLSLTFVLLEVIHASDRILLTWLLGIEQAGQYAAAISLPQQLLLMLANAMCMVLYPPIIEALEQQGEQQAATKLGHYLVLFSGVMLPAWLGLIAVSDDFLPLLLGPEYVASALQLLPWLGFAILLNCLYLFYVSYAFQLSQQTASTIRVVLAATLLNVLLNGLLIPLMGGMGAAIATIAAYAVCVVYGFGVGRALFPLLIDWQALCKVVLSALLMFAVITLLPLHYGWQQGLLRILVGMVVYTGLVLLLDIGGVRNGVWAYCREFRQ